MYRKLATAVCLTGLTVMGPHRTAFPASSANSNSLRATEPLWDSCQDDLDRTRRASSDASDAAKEVKSTHDDLDECQSDPQTFDSMGDGCRSRRSDYESALNDYSSKMDDLDSRLRDVQSSCGYEFSINRLSPLEASQQRLDSARRRLCASYRNFLPTLGPQNVLQMCKSQAGADQDWCKSCLGIP